jgi:hypothetical protein
MKLTKKLEAEIMNVYEAFWGGLLNVDIDIYAATLDTAYRLIGTTDGEVFFNKKEAIKFLKDTADQVAGNIERRKSKIKIEAIDDLVLITDQFDAYVLIENDWSFYGKTRVSTWMQQKSKDWKLIQQHFSLPDTKAEEGQTIGLEKISKENLELREAIKRRTIELEHKNHELEIEAALEKVRAVAMAMRKADDLMLISEVIYKQLSVLGFSSIRNVQIAIDDDEKQLYNGVEYSEYYQNRLVEVPYDSSPMFREIVNELKESKDAFYQKEIKGKDFEDWRKWRMNIDTKNHPEIVSATSMCFYLHSVGTGMLGISTFDAITNDQLEILKRLRNVFELSYRRYIDIEKAEAQAREAQIELGLERVRARAMAMQKSDELSELVDTVFKELTRLDFALTWCIINIIDENSMSNTVWAANPDIDKAPDSYHMLFEDYPFHDAMMKGWKQRQTKYVYTLEGLEKKVYDDYLFSKTEFKRTPEAAQAASRAMEKYVVSFSFSNFGGLQTVGDAPLSDANLDILSRFGKVFDLTYTRFNDLKQAEAQAKESQIQLALERVRARTMAMQHSDGLKDAAALLFQQVKALGVPAYSCGYNIWEKNENAFTSWMSSQDGSDFNAVQNIPLTEDANFIQYVESREKGEQFFVLELRGERMQEHYEYLKTIPAFKAYFDYAISVGFDLPKTQIHHLANFSHGNLLFITLEPCPEFHDVFKRFAAVFDQTYTRFLDLQKAEAQARESQIQLALERVRARTMAMQKSDELAETASLLFKQISDLGIQTWTSGFNIWEKDDTSFIGYNPTPSGEIAAPYHIPSKEDNFFSTIYQAKERNEDFFVFESSGDSLSGTYRYMKTLPVVKEVLKGIEDSGFQLPAFQINHCAFFSQGFLLFITIDPYPEAHDIFKRFGKVFEQTYTRFLDLQKSEAQARESQIQLALERVRARTMAMQKSDELPETSYLLFQQVKELGLTAVQNSIGIVNEQAGFVELSTTVQGHHLPHTLHVPINDPYVMAKAVDAWKAKHKSLKLEFTGEELKNYNEHRNSFFETKVNFPEDQWIVNIIFFSKGWLSFSGNKSISDETFDLLKRFAAVFEQTYTRFNDLKQAEEQARESQIQLAMERVRARTMAMQKSEELPEAANLLFLQVQSLGMPAWSAGYCIWHDDKNAITLSMSSEGVLQPSLRMPLTEDPSLMHFREAYERGETFFVEEVGGEELKRHYTYLRTLPGVKETLDDIEAAGFPVPTFQIFHLAYFSKGFLLFITYAPVPEAHDIFKRFAKVFEQTYTRFLDLQKAEGQARESQIQLALERVRARTMAMHSSSELIETAELLFDQMNQLGAESAGVAFAICEPDNVIVKKWTSIGVFSVPYTFEAGEQNMYEAWKNQIEIYEEVYEGDKLKRYLELFMEIPEFRTGFQKFLDTGVPVPTWQKNHAIIFKYGYLLLITSKPFKETHIFKRFAKVFEQTYTRFLDLQKGRGTGERIPNRSSIGKSAQPFYGNAEK